MSDTNETSKQSACGRRKLTDLANACVTGRLALAELELHGWCRAADCPPAARVMLASLLARQEDYDGARKVLQPVYTQEGDAMDIAESQLLVSVLVCSGLMDAAKRLAERMHKEHGDQPAVLEWLTGMAVPGAQVWASEKHDSEKLAEELSADLGVVPSLVHALKREPRSSQVSLLRDALQRLLGRKDASIQRGGREIQVQLCLALAELSLLLGDDEAARQWAHRGLRLDGYNAALALVLSKVSDDLSVGPSASEVLGRVAKKQPTYWDVRSAQVRRAWSEGDLRRARELVAVWLEDQPTSFQAQQLHEQLSRAAGGARGAAA